MLTGRRRAGVQTEEKCRRRSAERGGEKTEMRKAD